MTLDQFIAAHNGQYLVWDAHVGAQCVAVAQYYVRDVLGIPVVWANAVDWWGKDAAFEHWTPNVWGNRSSKPNRGSIPVWGPNARAGTGIYGHIAICTDPGDGLTFLAFSQNYPTGARCGIRRFAYDGVIGWGDRIAPPPVDPCAPRLALLQAQVDSAQAALAAEVAHDAAYRSAVTAWLGGAPK